MKILYSSPATGDLRVASKDAVYEYGGATQRDIDMLRRYIKHCRIGEAWTLCRSLKFFSKTKK